MHHKTPTPHDPGLRFIIAYKAVRSVISFLLAAGAITGLALGLVDDIQDAITLAQANLTAFWSMRVADWLIVATTRTHLTVAAVALTLDGILLAVESWALHKRHRWGEWLVVIASGTLIPIELYEVVKKVKLLRVLVLLGNGAIVLYLALRLKWEREAERASAGSTT